MNLGLGRFWRDLRERRYRFRQVTGGLFLVALVLYASPGLWGFVAGGCVAVLGVLLRLWAAGHVRKSRNLATRGPYAFVRHPQYLANSLIAVGISTASGHAWAVLIWGLIFWLCYLPAIEREDDKLHRRFGEDWEKWAAHTPAVLPARLPSRNPDSDSPRWSLRQAMRNGEPVWTLVISAALLWTYTRLPLA